MKAEQINISVLSPDRWGLDEDEVAGLGDALYDHWERFHDCFTTRTRDNSEQAYIHMRGQLTMESDRNFAHIEERVANGDGQALQHFMSNSPWSDRKVFIQLQHEVSQTAGVEQGSTLILDESADEKAGDESAGASRQKWPAAGPYNGRLGKIGLCQVATCLGYANQELGLWTLLDGELFLPQEW